MREVRTVLPTLITAVQVADLLDSPVVAPPSKRQKLGKGKGRSFATVSRENALAFSTPGERQLSLACLQAFAHHRRFAFAEILPPGWETEDWSTDFPTKSSLPRE